MNEIEDLSAIEPNLAAIQRAKEIIIAAEKIGLSAEADKDVLGGIALYFSSIDNKRIVWVNCDNSGYDSVCFTRTLAYHNFVERYGPFKLLFLEDIKTFLL